MKARRYSAIAMLLHWAIAIAVIVNWRIAESAEHLSSGEKDTVMANHYALGMTILVLTVLRVGWRLINPPPPMRAGLQPWERMLAKLTHALFYILLIAMPLMGWIGMSGYQYAVDMFGFVWPILPVGFGEDTGHDILEVHATMGTVVLVLVALHVLGALKHTFVDKDGNLWRMLPFGSPRA